MLVNTGPVDTGLCLAEMKGMAVKGLKLITSQLLNFSFLRLFTDMYCGLHFMTIIENLRRICPKIAHKKQ